MAPRDRAAADHNVSVFWKKAHSKVPRPLQREKPPRDPAGNQGCSQQMEELPQASSTGRMTAPMPIYHEELWKDFVPIVTLRLKHLPLLHRAAAGKACYRRPTSPPQNTSALPKTQTPGNPGRPILPNGHALAEERGSVQPSSRHLLLKEQPTQRTLQTSQDPECDPPRQAASLDGSSPHASSCPLRACSCLPKTPTRTWTVLACPRTTHRTGHPSSTPS